MIKEKKDCFIIMPITTPEEMVRVYRDDKDHFRHVLEHLFKPAIEKTGFNVISPISKGSDIIQAEIIKRLAEADLVLCDMSILNANVFFEFGIRTALDKPVALVIDDETSKIPFDAGMINYHKYSGSLAAWEIEKEIDDLAKHISDAAIKAVGKNSLWKYFGVAQVGNFSPGEATVEDKLNLILSEIMEIKKESHQDQLNLLLSEIMEIKNELKGKFKDMDFKRKKLAHAVAEKFGQLEQKRY